MKIDTKILKQPFLSKVVFAILSMRSLGFETPRRLEFDTKFGTKGVLKLEQQTIILALSANRTLEMGSENRLKIVKNLILTPHVHPAAPMVLQDAPEVPKWSPRVPE